MEKTNRLLDKIKQEALRQDTFYQKALHKPNKLITAAIHREIRNALERIIE